MKVFMLGWEFPPFISGGLGTACYGLTKAMHKLAADVTFVLPTSAVGEHSTHVKMLSPASLSQCSHESVCCIDDPMFELSLWGLAIWINIILEIIGIYAATYGFYHAKNWARLLFL